MKSDLVLAGGGESAPGTLNDDLRGPVAGVDALGDVLAAHQLGEEAPDEGITGACFFLWLFQRQTQQKKKW